MLWYFFPPLGAGGNRHVGLHGLRGREGPAGPAAELVLDGRDHLRAYYYYHYYDPYDYQYYAAEVSGFGMSAGLGRLGLGRPGFWTSGLGTSGFGTPGSGSLMFASESLVLAPVPAGRVRLVPRELRRGLPVGAKYSNGCLLEIDNGLSVAFSNGFVCL